MKMMLLILSVVLSLVCGGKGHPEAAASSDEGASCITETSSPNAEPDYSPNRDLCLSTAQGYFSSGNGNSSTLTVRNSKPGRRTSTQTRSTFRMVKGGKVIDNNSTHPFLTPVFVPLSGIHISERYLFSICRLRL